MRGAFTAFVPIDLPPEARHPAQAEPRHGEPGIAAAAPALRLPFSQRGCCGL